jgi:hypothetical protein
MRQQRMNEGIIDTACASIEVRDDVVVATAKPIAQELVHAREFVDAVEGVARERGAKVRLIIDIRKVRSLSRDARLLYQGEEFAQSVVGAAMIIDSGLSRVFGNFVIGLHKGPAPSRLFTSEADAREWLQTLSDD